MFRETMREWEKMTLNEAQAIVDAAISHNFPSQQNQELMDRIIVRMLENPEFPERFEASLHCLARDRFAVMQIVLKVLSLRGEIVTFP